MQPNNTPPPSQPAPNMPPAPVQTPPQPAPNAPPTQPIQQTPSQPVTNVSPSKTNYAGALFFTMLLVGFTFHMSALLYVPVLFFCIAAGFLFFKDVLTSKPQPVQVQPVAGYPDSGAPAVKPRRSTLKLVLLIIFGLLGTAGILFMAFIAFIMIMLGSSGV